MEEIADITTKQSTTVGCYEDGGLLLTVFGKYKSSCTLNLRTFPFDSQSCILYFMHVFRPRVFYETQNNLTAGVEFIIMTQSFGLKKNLFVSNSEWEVKNITFETREVVYKDIEAEISYPSFTVTIHLKRRPKFYVVSLILPLLSVVFIPTIGFLLPIESGEKVSLQVTAFLSYMVLLLVVIEVIPATADNFPVIGKLFKIHSTLHSPLGSPAIQ